MKKLLILTSLALAMAVNAEAQIVVTSKGTSHIGTTRSGFNESTSQASIHVWNILDPGATSLLSYEGGHIAFGRTNNAMIGGDGMKGFLQFRAKESFNFNVGDNVNAMAFNYAAKLFNFTYNIQAPSFLVSSDARYKTNVSSMDDMYVKLDEINPVTYTLAYTVKADTLSATDKLSKMTNTITDDRLHFGFIAQEIQKIYPNLVVADEDGMLSIDYIGFIPVLVEAYKDLSNKVKEQEDFIIDILKSTNPSYMPAAVNAIEADKAYLGQNKPNPFNSVTTIECSIPQNVSYAAIFIYDLQGKQVKRIDIHERGSINTTIEASSLSPGMYIYTLVADGSEVSSKRMIITD